MRTFAGFFILLSCLANALAYEYSKFSLYDDGVSVVRSCHTVLFNSATFCEKQKSKGYGCYCSNVNAMASMAGCVKLVHQDTKETFEWLIDYCKSENYTVTQSQLSESLDFLQENGKNFTAVPKSAKAANATSSSNSSTLIQTTQASSVSSASGNSTASSSAAKSKTAPKVNYPIFANETAVHDYYRAWRDRYDTFNWAYWFANALYAYWAFVFLIAAVCNWSVVLFPGLRTACNGRISKAWRKYVTLPALIRKKKTNHQEFVGILNFLVPSRFESIVLSGFFWLTFLFNALYMPYREGNPLFKTRYIFILRTVADRTGIIGTLLLPLLFLIGGRNNFLQWLTRWKFSTFVMYHRWIGRAIVAMVLIHTVAYTTLDVRSNNYASRMKQEYMIYGTVGTIAGCIICFQGLLYLRRNSYEVFLVIHILMAVAFMLGTWMHIRMRKYMEWIFATVAVWAFDRFVRLCRMAWFGVPKATVTLLADDCLRVVVPKPSHWPSVPGGHAWVYFCNSWYFWQSHPFTFLDSTVEKNKIVFILKTKKGATHYLTKMLATRPNRSCTIRVCVEGPYGEACSVKSHDNVVFVAGGNGIPGILSECYDLARKSAHNAKQQIKLVWVLRDISTIEWVWDELSSLKETKVQATIYITRKEGDDGHLLLERMSSRGESSSTEEKESYLKEEKDGKAVIELLKDHYPHIEFRYGRPSMDELVDEQTEEAISGAAFITCGHPLMVDDLRYAVVQKIDKTEKRVDFFEQLQVWA